MIGVARGVRSRCCRQFVCPFGAAGDAGIGPTIARRRAERGSRAADDAATAAGIRGRNRGSRSPRLVSAQSAKPAAQTYAQRPWESTRCSSGVEAVQELVGAVVSAGPAVMDVGRRSAPGIDGRRGSVGRPRAAVYDRVDRDRGVGRPCAAVDRVDRDRGVACPAGAVPVAVRRVAENRVASAEQDGRRREQHRRQKRRGRPIRPCQMSSNARPFDARAWTFPRHARFRPVRLPSARSVARQQASSIPPAEKA